MKKKLTLLAAALLNLLLVHAQWSLTGNAGTNPPTNFIGTTDAKDLVFKINNQFSGTINYSNSSTSFGHLAGSSPGSYSSAFGTASLQSNSTGNYNSAFGGAALGSNTTGTNNTAVGYIALDGNFTGSNNTAIGAYADWTVSGASYSNTTLLGFHTAGTASNQVRVGNSSVTSIGGYVGWSNISDGRFKKNVKENVPGLSFIRQLRPVTYNLDATSIDQYLHPNGKINAGQATIDAAATKTKEQIIYSGFIAQEVEATAKKMGYDFSGVDAAKNDKDLYSLRYSDFVVPLVKAVQEISALNDAKDAKIDSLQKQIDELRSLVLAQNGFSKNPDFAGTLEQNIPNPLSNSTSIGYILPQKFSSAQIMIADISGKTIKQATISGTGRGTLNIDISSFASGTYTYSLIVDNKLISTKRMVLAK